ncbi:MAG: hypothetical protein H7839_10990 [Magnetococcus sp. YQC-5]
MSIETQDVSQEMDDPEEWAEENPTAMQRIATLENEVNLLKAALYAIPAALEKEKIDIHKHLENFQTLQTRLTEISATTVQSNQRVEKLGKQVEVVKKDTSSWLMISIVVFGIFFIVSLFIRAG